MRKRLLMAVVVLVAATALVFSRVIAQDSTKTTTETKTTTTKTTTKTEAAKPAAGKFEYVGKDKCKLCHKQQHDSWLTTVHAKAWEALKPEEQKSDSCSVCHSTGKDAAGVLITGVQCEACHGAGSAYKTQANMKDVKLAMANGLIMPTKEVCVKCHNAKSPTFKGFEFEKAVKDAKAIHKAAPKKTETEG
jgi:hypothetical protein